MKTRCTMCLEYPRSGNLREFDGQHLCHACYEENVTLCDRCGEEIWIEKSCFYKERCLCNACYEHYNHKKEGHSDGQNQ